MWDRVSDPVGRPKGPLFFAGGVEVVRYFDPKPSGLSGRLTVSETRSHTSHPALCSRSITIAAVFPTFRKTIGQYSAPLPVITAGYFLPEPEISFSNAV